MEKVKETLVGNFALEVPVPQSDEVFNHFIIYAVIRKLLYKRSRRLYSNEIYSLCMSKSLAYEYQKDLSKVPCDKRFIALDYVTLMFVDGSEMFHKTHDKIGLISRNPEDLYFL